MPTLDNYSLGNYGLGGPGIVKYASGIATNDSVLMSFYNRSGGANSYTYLTVPLDFLPDVVIAKRVADDDMLFATIVDTKSPMSGGYTIFHFYATEFRLDGSSAIIRNDVFRLPVYQGSTQYFWQAFKTK